ncbi:MAG: ATP synthase subunit C [Nitrososphaerota archaeon]|nr:ATP synthase subunit C [Candidatus Calditenuaceae archaeon]MDW8073644.1 ATP synthase subunit C [Nitrososphaerota archaeon]
MHIKAPLMSVALLTFSLLPAAFAVEAPSDIFSKVFAAAIAFSAAVLASGFAISRAGSAGLAASAERPEVRTVAIIIAAFGEALAIYGIAIAFFILGTS